MVPSVESFLFDAEYDWSQVLVVGEVVPVLRAVEILFVRLLLDGGELEALIFLPLVLDGRLLVRRLVVEVGGRRVLALQSLVAAAGVATVAPLGTLAALRVAEAAVHGPLAAAARTLLVLLLLVDVVLRLALVPDRVRRDFLARALDPVARGRDQVVWKFFAKFI